MLDVQHGGIVKTPRHIALHSRITANRSAEPLLMTWQDRITVNPSVCHGKVCIRGRRVMVSVILDNLAAGESIEEIMHGYHLEREDVQGAMHCAAAHEQMVVNKATRPKYGLAELVKRILRGTKPKKSTGDNPRGRRNGNSIPRSTLSRRALSNLAARANAIRGVTSSLQLTLPLGIP
jgi:uncharacterized protein (DUF433 family)